MVVNLQFHIKTSDRSKVTISGDFEENYDAATNITTYDIGTLQYQQSRDILINLPECPDNGTFFYTYKIGDTSYKSEEYPLMTLEEVSTMSANNNFTYHEMRFLTIQTLRTIIKQKYLNDSTNALLLLETLKRTLTANNSNGMNDNITKLMETIFGNANTIGQVKLCIENDEYYRKWGVYYLDQFTRSLNQQMKPNFKDVACDFGGSCFNEIVNHASDIFDSIPPPTPSIVSKSNTSLYRSLGTASLGRVIDMSVYNNPNGGCFTGDSRMLLSNGGVKLVKDLTKGDKVLSLADPYNINSGLKEAKIVCILKMITNGRVTMVTTDKGLKITPWHPIISHGVWSFPANLYKTNEESCDELYAILLDNYFTFNLNGSWVIGIGHNYNVGILAHNYFGTKNIVNDLASQIGWSTGLVTINSSQFVRDYISHTIIGINFDTPNQFIVEHKTKSNPQLINA